VASAGSTFTSGGVLPTALLRGHPSDDAQRLDVVDVPALSGRFFLMRTDDAVGVGGLDCLLTWDWHAADLSLRLRDAGVGTTRLVSTSRVWTDSEVRKDAPTRDAVVQDDALFRQRWSDRLPPRDASLWERAG